MNKVIYRTRYALIIMMMIFTVNGFCKEGVSAASSDEIRYASVLNKYYTALKNQYTAQQYSNMGIHFECAMDKNTLYTCGYYFEDINKDGTKELFIGPIDAKYDNNKFYALYTIKSGEIVRVFASGARYPGFKLNNGNIYVRSSSGANWTYYELEKLAPGATKLSVIEMVFHDSYYDKYNPWFYNTSGDVKDYQRRLSESTARTKINNYVSQITNMQYKQFSKYSMSSATSGSTSSSSIKLSKSSATLYITGKKTVQLKATVTGKKGTVKWTSKNKKVATVSSKGKVTAKSAGVTYITATVNGKTKNCKITVKPATTTQIKNAYKKRINQVLYPKYGSTKAKYVDINKDGTTEMIYLYGSNMYGYASAKVYTYKNGKPVLLNSKPLTGFTGFSLNGNKYLVKGYGIGSNAFVYEAYQISGNKLKKTATYKVVYGKNGIGATKYYKNNQLISKQKYDSFIKQNKTISLR